MGQDGCETVKTTSIMLFFDQEKHSEDGSFANGMVSYMLTQI